MAIEVRKPGLFTTVQDMGRPGYYHLGIPLSGAMDRAALRTANLLVGNPEAAAALEITLLGPELRFTGDASVAVTGAELPPKLDGEARPGWTCFAVKAGQVLGFDFLRKGARAYLAVAGGIDVPEVLGSRSNYVLGGLGGLEGRSLRAGDTLAAGPAAQAAPVGMSLAETLRPAVGSAHPLRVLPGLYWHRLMEAALTFTKTPSLWRSQRRASGERCASTARLPPGLPYFRTMPPCTARSIASPARTRELPGALRNGVSCRASRPP